MEAEQNKLGDLDTRLITVIHNSVVFIVFVAYYTD